jgi:high affinity sulfate transporter 1
MHWLIGYRRAWLRPDLVAGLTTAAVVIPKGMAYATVAGLPIEAGLYTAFVPIAIYAVLGSSRVLSVSTTTTIAILVAAALAVLAPDGDPAASGRVVATLALLVGGILVVASVLRLGFLANFISEPVLVGFKAGIGLVIIVDQLPKLLGVHFPKGTFLHNIGGLVQSLPQTSLTTLAVALVVTALMLGLEHALPRAPAPLIALGAAIAGMAFLGLGSHGVDAVGHIPSGLPRLTLPDTALFVQLWPAAAGIALMSFTETIAAGRAFVGAGEPLPRPNRELLATGIASAGGALLGAMPAGGGTSQTAVNRLAGAQSQMSGLVAAGVAVLTMMFLAGIMGLMPQAALAAVVIVYSLELIKLKEFRAIHAVRRMEFVWAIAALVGVVALGTLRGILVAIILSLVALAQQAANPQVVPLARKPGTNVFRPRSAEHPDDETFPGLLLVRVVGRLFFGNYQRVFEKVRALGEEVRPRVLAVDLSGVFDVEYTALKMLTEAEERMRAQGIALWLVGLTPAVLAVVQRSPIGETLGRDRLLFNAEAAVAKYGALPAPPEPAAG